MMNNATGTLSVGNALKVAATRHRGKEMLSCMTTDRRFTFDEVNRRTNQLANGLSDLGVGKGDAVAFICNNRAELVETYFALAKLGAVGMPINYRLSSAEIVDLVEMVDAKALIFAPRFQGVAKSVQDVGLEHYISIGVDTPEFALDYEDLLESSRDDEPEAIVSEADAQYYNLTSGTTGSPKTYVLNHYNNAIAGTLMMQQFELTSEDVALTVFPMFGRVGFGWTLASVIAGCRNVITDFEPKSVAQTVTVERCTIVNLVPTMAQMLMNLDDFEKWDFSSFRGIVFAGAPLPTNVYDATMNTLCANIYEYYGMQETGVVADITPEKKKRKPSSVGQATVFCEVRLVDPMGDDVPPHENGAIIVRAPTATKEYFQNPEKTRETFQDGWIRTGDIGQFDEDGFLYITGRAKEIIVSGGQNVFSAEVEDRLLTHPAVQECSVIGLPDDFWGELVTAVVVARPGSEVTEDELIEFCREALAGFKTPKKVLWRTEPIPRTPTGKITKFSLLEEYSDL